MSPLEPVEVSRRQQPQKCESLLQLVLEHVKDFKHTPAEVQALDRFGARSHRGELGEVFSWLTINLQVHGQPVVEFVWNVKQSY